MHRLGVLLFPVAIFAFGIEHLLFARAAADAMFPWVLGAPAWNVTFGVLLVALSIGIGTKTRSPLAARVLGATLFVYALLLYVPRIAAHVRAPGPWTRIFGVGSPLAAAAELLAMSGAAWVLAGSGVEGRPRVPSRMGRLLFAGPLVVFGLQHLLYRGFLSTLVPSWVPGPLFFTEVVGAAFLAAAAAIATNKAARPAALLLGTMFGLIVLTLHVPRVVAAAGSLDEWNSAFVALAMTGGAFVVADASKESASWLPTRKGES
ncbi:MAG TPA: hypothetical protein VMN04_04470 [Thermoanaerobaculia bacterium]|nr:hypothetical protein [Thermoanaerobaculia bacterium]